MFLRYTVEKELTRKINVKVEESDSFIYAGRTYELCGFTVHTGASGNSGHYRAYRVSGVVYDDHGGASEPTLRKISPEGLDKQKQNGYIYLYKKKIRPSESGSNTVQSSMATDTTYFTEETPAVDTVLTSRAQDTHFNDCLMDPVVKTPSKGIKRKLALTPEASQKSSCSDTSSDKTDTVKRTKKLLPSPGKRWLADASQVSSMETIEEMAETIALGQTCHEPVKVSHTKKSLDI